MTIVGGEVSLVCWPRGKIEDDVASMSSLMFRDVLQPADSSSATTYNFCYILSVNIVCNHSYNLCFYHSLLPPFR